MHKVRINISAGGFGQIFLDDREVQDVVSVGFNASTDELPEVTIVVRAESIELDCEGKAQLVAQKQVVTPCEACGEPGDFIASDNRVLCTMCMPAKDFWGV